MRRRTVRHETRRTLAASEVIKKGGKLEFRWAGASSSDCGAPALGAFNGMVAQNGRGSGLDGRLGSLGIGWRLEFARAD